MAHMDHDPANNDMRNLRAWCQRCHNTWDAPMRAAGVKARREQRALEAEGWEKTGEGTILYAANPEDIGMVIRRSVE